MSSACLGDLAILASLLLDVLTITDNLPWQGLCMILGGIKFHSQRFNHASAGISSLLLFVAVSGKSGTRFSDPKLHIWLQTLGNSHPISVFILRLILFCSRSFCHFFAYKWITYMLNILPFNWYCKFYHISQFSLIMCLITLSNTRCLLLTFQSHS